MKRTGLARRLGVFAALATLGILGVTQAVATAHSGGTDKYGCHAGSQPYHCHGGGSGGSSGGSSSYDSGPSAAEIAAAEAATAQRREIAAAQTEVAEAKAKETTSTNELAELERRHATAKEELNRQREPYETLAEKVARYNRLADDRRDDRIKEQKAAAFRIAAVKQDNQDARRAYFSTVTSLAFFASFFGTFLLLPLVRRLASLLLPWRWLFLLGDLIALVMLLALSGSSGALILGGISSAVAGVMLTLLFMLPALWWLPFKIPTPVAVVLLGISALIAVAGIGALATESAPVAEQPASSDVEQVQAAKADPTAEELAEAQKAEAAAQKLEPQLKDLSGEVAAAQRQEEELSQLVAKARAKVDAAAQQRATAEADLANLQ